MTGPSNRGSRLVPVEAGLLLPGAVGVERVRVERFVPVVLVEGAVVLVGSAPGDHVHDAAAGAAVLRVVDARLDAELRCRVRGRHEAEIVRLVGLGPGVRHPVQQELVGESAAATDLEIVHAAVVERPVGAARECGRVLHARRELRQREGIAAEQRQILDLRTVDDLAAHRVRRFENGRRSGDDDLFSERSDLQRQIDGEPIADANLDRFPLDGRESCERGGQEVLANRDERVDEGTLLVRHGRQFRIGTLIAQRHRDSG